MNLDDFLASAGGAFPAPVKHVKFRAIGRNPSGPDLMAVEVEATLVFVSESERQQVHRDAWAEMRKLYKDDPIPPSRIEDEIIYHFLFKALRDSSSQSYIAPFARSVEGLKKALVITTATEVYSEYQAFVRDEFPERMDAEEFKALVDAAEKKSLADLLSGPESYSIRRALPSLAAHFGQSQTTK